MSKFILAFICIGILMSFTNCGGSSIADNASNDTMNTDSVNHSNFQKVEHTTGIGSKTTLANKIFGFGKSRQNCNGLTYAEHWATMKFNADNTVTSVSAAAQNVGREDFYELRVLSTGNYAVEKGIVTVEFTQIKEEKIKHGKLLEANEQVQKLTWSLKVTSCGDGKLQLISNMPGKNARGMEEGTDDKSSWTSQM